MSYKEAFEYWKTNEFFDPTTRSELSYLDPEKDAKEIEDRFYRDLEFGTGGLRGVMGAGTNRMNKYTVGKATKGLGNYLLDTFGTDMCRERGVVIGYDTRNNSRFFSETAADVLSAMGIKGYIHSSPRPTPQLSFSVKYYNCLAGIVLTASHNPKEYNGYKVYDEFGCQIVPWQAKQVIAYVNAVTDYTAIDFSGNKELITDVDVTDAFVSAVADQSRIKEESIKSDLKVVYAPLHGSGNIPVKQILKTDGFENVKIVSEQDDFNGNFPTVVSPNPEDRRALELGIALAKKTDSDIVIGTDPDCDRVGVAVKVVDGEYKLLTGNQIGALLMNFVLTHTDLTRYYLGNNPPHREFVKRLKEKTGCKIVALVHLDEYIKSDNEYADETPYDVDPGDFLNLIRYASYVCTDSFHCSVFSMLYNKTFFTFRRYSRKTASSTNSRLDTLFAIAGIENRILSGNEEIGECLDRVIDYDKVEQNLKTIRNYSFEYLKKAIKDEGDTDL